MLRINFKRTFALIVCTVVLASAYMNCTRTVRFEGTQANSSGGGDGYSGKLYVILNSSGACADGSLYESQIQTYDGISYLVREACAAIEPQAVNVLISSVDNDYLAFNDQVFQQDNSVGVIQVAPTILAAMGMKSSNSLNHVCTGSDCWKFEANGAISADVDFRNAGDYDFVLLAHSDLALGVGANIDLKVDGVVNGSATVASVSDAEYKIRANIPFGRHNVEVAFTNDYQDVSTSADRNLYLTSVQIESVSQISSMCLARTSGPRITLASSQAPYSNKSLVANSVVDASAINYLGAAAAALTFGGGTDSCMAGGKVSGSWSLNDPYSSYSGTWAIVVKTPNFLVENYRVDNYGDCLGIWDNAAGFEIRGAYCSQIRGDLVSNKNSWSGTIEDSLFDGGSTFFNDNGSAAAQAGAITTIRNNLVRLQHYDINFYGTPGHGWFFKQDPTASAVKLRLHGNIFMAEEAPVTGSQVLNGATIASCKKADGSPDNTIVWLGSGAYPFPSELATGCFTLSTDRNDWDQAVASWKARHGY